MSDVLSGLQSVAEEEGSSASPIAIPRLFINDAKLNEHSSSPAGSASSTKSDNRMPKLNPNWSNTPTIVALVGLPARGKTYISNRLSRYLNWVGINTRVFNVGTYRRRNSSSAKFQNADFFNNNNKIARELRLKWRSDALADIEIWFREDHGQIAIYDATNVERSARQFLMEFTVQNGFKLFFVESQCNDPDVIQQTVREVKLHGPDYVGIEKRAAEDDFNSRIENYSKVYDPMCTEKDGECSFIKLIDVGRSYIVNRVTDHIQSRMVYYLMNVKVGSRSIYLSRHGESEMNLAQRIGGDSNLSFRGKLFGEKLGEFVRDITRKGNRNLSVWTSELRRTQQTAAIAGLDYEPWKALNEIDAGVCEGLTYDEIKEKYPIEYEQRRENKYYYRYPMGESYYDLVVRLEPVIMELERSQNVLVICHQAVVRCLLAYFQNLSVDELPFIKVPLHTVIKLTQHAHACDVELIPLGVEGVDTHQKLTPCRKISSS